MKFKVVLLIALLAAFGSHGFAQTKKAKVATVPAYSGSPQTDKTTFKSFIIKNIGRRVSLKLTFDDEDIPYGYKSNLADPFFGVDNFSYFFDCGEDMDADWTTRCKKINWNANDKTVVGFFKITEPAPRTMRTNRSFTLTPSK